MVVAFTRTSLVLLNFDVRTTKTPSAQSMSPRSSAMASPTRRPVAASNPIMVWTVAARSGGNEPGTSLIRPRCRPRSR